MTKILFKQKWTGIFLQLFACVGSCLDKERSINIVVHKVISMKISDNKNSTHEKLALKEERLLHILWHLLFSVQSGRI